ncbi:hypothetical protein HD554DRAFT_2038328 [Boletus coccyginus]|nr:hypothetical protein HD554DRAFT_2038328 [Boletus coccyginus]
MASPSLEKKLLKMYTQGIDSMGMIQGSTDHLDIAHYGVHFHPLLKKESFVYLMYTLLRRLKKEEQMLIFFNSCDKANCFSKSHSFAIFHSQLQVETKNSNLCMWNTRKSKVMACILVFSTGVDHPNVRFVVIHDPTYGPITTIQMAERAERDGKGSHVFFATSEQPLLFQKCYDPAMTWELGQLMHKKECRVFQVMSCMDGPHLAWKCHNSPRQVPCNVCEPDREMHQFALTVMKNPGQEVSARVVMEMQSSKMFLMDKEPITSGMLHVIDALEVFQSEQQEVKEKLLRGQMIAKLDVGYLMATQDEFMQWAVVEDEQGGKYHNCLEALSSF